MESLTRKIAAAPHSTAEATTDHFRAREFITVNSSYILEDELRLYIIATLSLLWISAQLRRFVSRDANAGCWYGWDAFALATVAFSLGQRQYAITCIFTPAYFVWTRLPGSPFNDLHLPGFSAFLDTASEQQADGIVNQKATMSVHIAEDAPACLVCWVSDKRPLVLPCNHFMCRECLSTMKGRRQTCCPLCRRPLFHDNDGVQCAIHKAVIATFAAKLATDGIHHLLQLWHGQYWELGQAAITYIPQFYCFRVLHIVLQTQGIEWWQFGIFDYLMPLPVPEGRFWRSVWPPVIFTLLFFVGIFGGLLRIARLNLVVERVSYQDSFPQLYAP